MCSFFPQWSLYLALQKWTKIKGLPLLSFITTPKVERISWTRCGFSYLHNYFNFHVCLSLFPSAFTFLIKNNLFRELEDIPQRPSQINGAKPFFLFFWIPQESMPKLFVLSTKDGTQESQTLSNLDCFWQNAWFCLS